MVNNLDDPSSEQEAKWNSMSLSLATKNFLKLSLLTVK